MMRLAVAMAKEIHDRYPDLSFPVDMGHLAKDEGCEIVNWPFKEPVREVKRGRWIGLAFDLNSEERRHLIAHALAHQLLHRGNQLLFYDRQRTSVFRQEREAEECAAHILMPEEELQKVDSLPAWEIAEYFGVPQSLVQLRFAEFATDAEIARWVERQESEDWDV